MGYKRKLYELKWPDGHELAGLEVTTKGLSVDKLFDLATLADQLTSAPTVKEQAAAARLLCEEFAARLVAWNLEEDDGTPVPVTAGGVAGQDMGFMLPVIMTWMDEVANVDIPLPQASPPGATTETEPDMAALIPVETLSSSPLS